jgi:hypothetical protein
VRVFAVAGVCLLEGAGCGPAGRGTSAPAVGRGPRLPGSAISVSRGPLACEAEEGPPPDCSVLSGASCLGASLARRACATAGPLLRPTTAGLWLACMGERTDTESQCDSGRIVACGLRASETACVDGSFRELCGALSADCADVAPEITPGTCERLLGAFRPEHRPKLVDCLRQGCGTGAFGACLP